MHGLSVVLMMAAGGTVQPPAETPISVPEGVIIPEGAVPVDAYDSAQTKEDVTVSIDNLVRAMGANDTAIESLCWNESIYVRNAVGDLVVGWRGRFGEDSLGNWFFHGENGTWNEDRSSLQLSPIHYAFDGQRMQVYDDRGETGLIQPTRGEHKIYVDPTMLLGRHIDPNDHLRLSEIVASAHAIRLIGFDAVHSIARLEADITLQKPMRLVIDVDTKLACIPVRIRRYDPWTRTLKEDLQTTKVIKRDGVIVPVEGIRVVYTADIAAKERELRDFAEMLEAAGIDDSSDVFSDDTQRVIAESIRRVFGTDGIPMRTLGAGINYMYVTAIDGINRPLPPDEIQIQFPDGVRVLNVFSGEQFVVGDDEQ